MISIIPINQLQCTINIHVGEIESKMASCL